MASRPFFSPAVVYSSKCEDLSLSHCSAAAAAGSTSMPASTPQSLRIIHSQLWRELLCQQSLNNLFNIGVLALALRVLGVIPAAPFMKLAAWMYVADDARL